MANGASAGAAVISANAVVGTDAPVVGGASVAPAALTSVAVVQTLGAVSDLLLRQPASENYSEDQKRACIAGALRLQDTKLGEILEELRHLALPFPGKCNQCEPSVQKALTILLSASDVVASGTLSKDADLPLHALFWKLARASGPAWPQEHRLLALSILLSSSGRTAEELLRLTAKASQDVVAATLCVILEVDAGASTLYAEENIVLLLGRGRLPASLGVPRTKILAALLRCEATEASLLANLNGKNEGGWSREVLDLAKQVATQKAPHSDVHNGDAEGKKEKPALELEALKALAREPHEKQISTISGMLGLSKEAHRGAAIVTALALDKKTESLPVEVLRAILGLVLGVPAAVTSAATSAEGASLSALPEKEQHSRAEASKALVRRIAVGSCGLSTPLLRLHAFACLARTAPCRQAVLLYAVRGLSAKSLSPRACRDIAECVLLEKPLGASSASEKRGGSANSPLPQAAILFALQHAEDLSAEVRWAVMDALAPAAPPAELATPNGKRSSATASPSPKKSEQRGGNSSNMRETEGSTRGSAKAERIAASPPPMALGEKALKDVASPSRQTAVGGATVRPSAHTPESKPSGRFGLGVLELEAFSEDDVQDAAMATDDPLASAEEDGWDALAALLDEDAGEEDNEEEDEEGDEDDEASDADDGSDGGKKARDDEAEEEDEASDDDEDEDDEEDDLEVDIVSVSEDSAAAGELDVESYYGSELDPLDVPDGDSADGSGVDKESDEGFDIGDGGLLTGCFSGGTLHSEGGNLAARRAAVQDRRQTRPQNRRTQQKVVFPTLIWKGGDVLVINKPADWICSASDVDKKKGRALDPNEKVANKGFSVMEDLLEYQFAEREKKYIHWWIQLKHNLDEETYSNLFDEDQNYGLCHRLDRETSGTVLVGLTALSRTQMRECFHRHYVRKLYVCLVHGHVHPTEQTIDRNLEAMGQKARLHQNGRRARTHAKVLGHYTRKVGGRTEEYSLCTCEIAEGRMHQIRLHMSCAIGAPIVSEFYYQKPRQMIEDRRWCSRVFLHAYAVGFPEVSGDFRRMALSADPQMTADINHVITDEEQEWHCCICPLTEELQEALKQLTPCTDQAASFHDNIMNHGLLAEEHETVHCNGTGPRKDTIDAVFFPWSSHVNPIEAGDLARPRDVRGKGDGNGKGKGRGKGEKGSGKADGAGLTQKMKQIRRGNMGGRPGPRGRSGSGPRCRSPRKGGGRARMRGRSRGRAPPPPRSESPLGKGPPLGGPKGEGRRIRRSLSRRRRSLSRRRLSGAPPSPRRSLSAPLRRLGKRRRPPSPTSASPLRQLGPPEFGGRRALKRRYGGKGGFGREGGFTGTSDSPPRGGGKGRPPPLERDDPAGGGNRGESPQRVVLTACR